jgi:hypothetical protein
LILQGIADRPHQKTGDILIYIGVLAAKCRYGNGYGGLHGAQPVRNLTKAGSSALRVYRRTGGHCGRFL